MEDLTLLIVVLGINITAFTLNAINYYNQLGEDGLLGLFFTVVGMLLTVIMSIFLSIDIIKILIKYSQTLN